jgi:hypothetical protein
VLVFESNLCHFFVCLFQFIFLHFLILFMICLCVFLSFAGNLSLYFQELQVVSRVTFTRNSLHARLHSR